MSKLLDGSVKTMAEHMKNYLHLHLAQRNVIGMDCWSKKSLTASFLPVSASFYHPPRNQPIHVLLNLQQIAHSHTTEDMLAHKLLVTLNNLEIRSKVLIVVTDNGSNTAKAVNIQHVVPCCSIWRRRWASDNFKCACDCEQTRCTRIERHFIYTGQQTAMTDVLEMHNKKSHTSEELQELYDSLNSNQKCVVDKVVSHVCLQQK